MSAPTTNLTYVKQPILLIPHRDHFTLEYLASLGNGPILACDFYAEGAENWTDVPGGYESGRVINIDHHAPHPRMWRHVSSTNLAMERLAELGPESEDSLVVISHTDCDSVLSSGIMSGELPPDPTFGAAAIAADHTGEENEIADLLQSFANQRDIQLSLRNLRLFMEGGAAALEEVALTALADRRRKCLAAADLVARGEVKIDAHLAVGEFNEKIDGEFFVPLLADAWAILLFSPRGCDKWDVKLWLGKSAPEGASIHNTRMAEVDPNYAGRWNAGSNSRNGGTMIHPAEYKAAVLERLPLITGGNRR